MSISAVALLLILPLATLVAQGVPALAFSDIHAQAMFTSLVFGTATAITTTVIAYTLAHAAARNLPLAKAGQLASLAGLALPPAVIATGWFLLAIATVPLWSVAPLLIVLVNALIALPFAYTVILPALRNTAQQDRLAQSLGLKGWTRLLTIDRRAVTQPLLSAFAMVFVLSLGDLAAILFLGDGHYVTLPALIYQQMGSYRMEGAMGTALLLAALSWLVLALTETAREHA
jgi:thiamine transport system permease protein